MTKQEMAAYLSSLCAIMDSIDDGGATLRPQWVGEEYKQTWNAFKEAVRKEQEDEARKRQSQQDGTETRADPARYVTGWSEPDRSIAGGKTGG